MTKIAIAAAFTASLWAAATLPSAGLFENDFVKVTRALERPHVKGSFHEHKTNRVMIYLEGGRQHFEYQDGRKAADFDWKAGQVVWSEPDGIHSPEVVSDEGFNIIEIELKKPGGAAAKASAKVEHGKVELDNAQVRVVRLKLAPHEATSSVERNTIVAFLTDDGAHKAGDAIWETPGAAKIENTGNTPAEIVLVELKN